VAIFIDGKRYADDGLMIALGITLEGKKIVLGIEQTATENYRPLSRFFEKLIERGLRYEEGLLFIIDGSKGIIRAVGEVFPTCGIIQRCHYHKIENVVSYLPKGLQGIWRAKLRAAYKETTYEAAKQALDKLEAELNQINPSAASSLCEGLDETLSLHRLGLYVELGKSFTSTNCIESVMSQLGQYTDKVDRWRGGAHIQRWAAAGLLALEPRLSRVKGFRHLRLLRMKLQEEVARRQKKQPLECSTSDDLGVGIHQSIPEN
jgi:transposase-like protein